jgi:2-hydroxychromene-2-carboxylate isomerase
MDPASDDRTVEYFFSFLSLWSYVGSLAFRDLAERHRLNVVPKPMDLMAIFAASGGKPVKERAPQRQTYRFLEMQRWREARGIPLVLRPKFYPADPSRGHRMLLAAIEAGDEPTAFIHAALRAVWADELDIADPATLSRLADQSGLDGARLLEIAEEPRFDEQARELTQEALDRQVFGAPFYVYRGEAFWGQDRLDMLDAAISCGRPPIAATPLA